MRADDEDEVVEDVSEAAEDDERLAAVAVRPGAGEERVHHGGQGLQHSVVRLQRRHAALHLDLSLVVVENVGADGLVVAQVHRAHLVDVQVLRNDR